MVGEDEEASSFLEAAGRVRAFELLRRPLPLVPDWFEFEREAGGATGLGFGVVVGDAVVWEGVDAGTTGALAGSVDMVGYGRKHMVTSQLRSYPMILSA